MANEKIKVPAADDYVGRVVLGRYRIVRVLARGGMGVIYLARSEGAAGFVKPVVVKRILADLVLDEAMVRMFKREARIMSNLRHPGVVSVTDFGQEKNAYFMVLDYVHGFHLGRWYRFMRVTRDVFPVELGIHIVVQVLEALHYAHLLKGPEGQSLHIVHRDVTPSNVLIDLEGHVKLADFGIAQMKTDTTEFRTSETTIKGKFPYIPPEVFRGSEPTAQGDVYAAAVVLHEVLAGKNEFRTKDVSATIAKVINHVPTPLSQLRDDVTAGLDRVLAKALEKDADRRFHDAAAFAAALRSVRRMSSDRADAELSRAAQRDFPDARMSDLFQVPRLEELEAAWRSVPPPAEVSSSEEDELAKAFAEAPELLIEDESRSLGQRPQVSRRVIALSGLMLLALIATLSYLLLQRDTASTPVIVYQGEIGEAPASDSQAHDPSAEQEETASSEVSADEEGELTVPAQEEQDQTAAKPSSAQARSDAISRAFARRGAAIQKCFEEHVGDELGISKLSVRLEITPLGAVSSAELTPKRLATSTLGRCVLEVARATEFPRQRQHITVRIPITTRMTMSR